MGAASRILKSKMEKTAAAVVAGVVGIGLLASPFLVLGNDEETNDAPEVSCLWVANFGSIGFDVEFDVSESKDGKVFDKFNLWVGDDIVDSGSPPSATIESEAPNQGWLDIPGYDGSGIPLPYVGYVHSFSFEITGENILTGGFIPVVPLGGRPPGLDVVVSTVEAKVQISLYVVLNSEGVLDSMYAYAYDSDGDFYEVPVYYSAGGRNFETFED